MKTISLSLQLSARSNALWLFIAKIRKKEQKVPVMLDHTKKICFPMTSRWPSEFKKVVGQSHE